MLYRIKINDELKQFIEDTCNEYKQKYRKHRKDITHLSKNGCFKEWKSYKYIEK